MYSLFNCEPNNFGRREDSNNILLKSDSVNLDNLYCLNIRKWYGRRYYYHTVKSLNGDKIQLTILEDKDRILCPHCQSRDIVIQKTNMKTANDIFMFENACKSDSRKHVQIEREKCFAPSNVGLIELNYQSNTYRCLECNKLFRLETNFIISEKSHYTKRFVSFLKYYDSYYWTYQGGKTITKMQDRWQGFIWNGNDIPDEYEIRKQRFYIKYSTYYYLIQKTPEIELKHFSEDWSDDSILSVINSLPYILRAIGKI